MSATCEGCGHAATHVLVNGEERVPYCKYCAATECGDMVLSNDSISFVQRTDPDGTILIVVGGA